MGLVRITSWYGIQNSMEAILACRPALSTEWLDLGGKMAWTMTCAHSPHWHRLNMVTFFQIVVGSFFFFFFFFFFAFEFSACPVAPHFLCLFVWMYRSGTTHSAYSHNSTQGHVFTLPTPLLYTAGHAAIQRAARRDQSVCFSVGSRQAVIPAHQPKSTTHLLSPHINFVLY